MTLQEVKRPIKIAVDGPAGAGKSTVAKIVAERLGYLYIDTGAMYRALALKALLSRVDLTDDDALGAMAAQTSVRLEIAPEGGNIVFLDDREVTTAIRQADVEQVVARVSSVPRLRRYMVQAQREIARNGGVVMDGRDIGSHVLPDAQVKFFVTASLEERALRRQRQQVEAGREVSLTDLMQEIASRDEQDRNKGEGSLIQVPDALLIDTTGRSIEAVVTEILSYCRRG